MSSILSAQNLQTLRRRNSVRFWASFLSPPRPLAGLALGRQSTGHAPALRGFFPQRPCALDDAVFFVNADGQMTNHLIVHTKPAVELLHQLAGTGDQMEHV